MTEETDKEHKENTDLLYDMLNDFVKRNEMEVNQVIGVLETFKLELMVTAILNLRDEKDEENDYT